MGQIFKPVTNVAFCNWWADVCKIRRGLEQRIQTRMFEYNGNVCYLDGGYEYYDGKASLFVWSDQSDYGYMSWNNIKNMPDMHGIQLACNMWVHNLMGMSLIDYLNQVFTNTEE